MDQVKAGQDFDQCSASIGRVCSPIAVRVENAEVNSIYATERSEKEPREILAYDC
jgi:hypothetical protein